MTIPATEHVDTVEESGPAPPRMTSMPEHKARQTAAEKPQEPAAPRITSMFQRKPKQKAAEKPQLTINPDAKEAASRVRFAKMYLTSGKKEKAVPILREVIAKYPDTQAAEKAQAELRKLGKK